MMEIKKLVDINIKKINIVYSRLLKSFEKCISS
jgi:hypothetical protein